MNLKKMMKTYCGGWLVLIKSLIIIFVWEIIIFLPMFLFIFIFPDHMEGKADGALRVQVISMICLLIWAPAAAAKLGPLEMIHPKQGNTGQPTGPADNE